MSATAYAPHRYDPWSTPHASDDRSRYAEIGRSPGGFAESNAAKNVASIYSGFLARLQEEARILPPNVKRVKLFKVIKTQAGGWELVSRPEVVGQQTHESSVPTKFSGDQPYAGAIDKLWLQEDHLLQNVRDDFIWQSLLLLIRSLDSDGREARRLNDYVACLVLLRHGLMRSPQQLRWA